MQWYLSITEEQFKAYYPNADIEIFKRNPRSDEDLVANFLTSKLWRMNNLYKIVDKDGHKIPFLMNEGQHDVKSAQLRHSRIIVLKSRQRGISTYWLLDFFDDAIFIDDLNIGMLAQGLEEASNLLEKVKLAWEEFPPNIKDFLGIRLLKDNSKEFSFNNGSKIFIRTSFRSATLQRLHVSELGKISAKDPLKAKELMSGTMQAVKAGNPVVLESTAEGRKNLFYNMWYTAVDFVGERGPKAFKPVFLSWVQDMDSHINVPQRINAEDQAYLDKVEHDLDIELTDTQKWWAVSQRDELREDFDQEYPYSPEAAFAAVRDGAYYSKLWRKHKRIVSGLYDEALDVFVAMDLGMSDTMVVVYWQEYKNSDGVLEVRIIQAYANSGEGLSHYANHIKDTLYNIEMVYVPHDAMVRELNNRQTRVGRLRELGINKIKVLPRLAVQVGIEAVRRILPHVILDESCDYIDDTFHNYSKEWDEKLGVWKERPLHDEWSHPADAIRYLAVSRYINLGKRAKPTRKKKRLGGGKKSMAV